jgi:asparagine synthase (glutamine-hydrolysing)
VCGIAGIATTGDPPDPQLLAAMAAAMAHRGPDGHGTAVLGSVGLAAARLAIRDLTEAGDQPMRREGQGLVFNGEVYNLESLRAEVVGAGTSLEGRSDTEVVAHLIRLQGLDHVLPRLRGMFALAWTDGRGRVLLARDRLGIKPLHWTRHGGTVAWASEVKALAPVAALRPDPARSLFAVLSLADRWGSRTVFDDVHQVPPGGIVEVAPDGTTSSRTWYRLSDDVDPALAADLGAAGRTEVRERLGALLDAAVPATSASDGRVATLVSGGLDSSVVASIAAEHDPDLHLHAAAVGGPHDERAGAQALADALGRPLTATPFTPAMVLADWATCTWHHEAPIVTHLNALPLARVAGAVRAEGTTAVLTGEGADELFAGYPSMASRRHLDLLRLPYQGLRRAYGLVPGLAERVLPGGPSQEGYLAALSDDFETARLGLDADEAFGHLPPEDARHGVLSYVALQGHLRTLLHRNDRMGMQHSVECRFPYLDEDVVRFGLNLPKRHKLALTPRVHDPKHPFVLDKAVLRDVAGRRALPGARLPKAGFPTWGHVDMRVQADLFSGGWVADALELSPSAIEHLVEREDPYHVAKLASVEVFGLLYGRGDTPDQVREHVERTVRMVDRGDARRAQGRGVAWTRWRSPI